MPCDEPWACVGGKRNAVWVWVALVATGRKLPAIHVGDRTAVAGGKPWELLQAECRRRALVHAGLHPAHAGFLPAGRHRPAGKGAGTTGRLERFDCTPRQRSAGP